MTTTATAQATATATATVTIKREYSQLDDPDDRPLNVVLQEQKRQHSAKRRHLTIHAIQDIPHIRYQIRESPLMQMRVLLAQTVFDHHIHEIDVRAIDWLKNPAIVQSMKVVERKALVQYHAWIDRLQDKEKNQDEPDVFMQQKKQQENPVCLPNPLRWHYTARPAKIIFLLSPNIQKRLSIHEDGSIQIVKPVSCVSNPWMQHGQQCDHCPTEQYLPMSPDFDMVGTVKVSQFTRLTWPLNRHCPRLYPIQAQNYISEGLLKAMFTVEHHVFTMAESLGFSYETLTQDAPIVPVQGIDWIQTVIDATELRSKTLVPPGVVDSTVITPSMVTLITSITTSLTTSSGDSTDSDQNSSCPSICSSPSSSSDCGTLSDKVKCFRNPYKWDLTKDEDHLVLRNVCNHACARVCLHTYETVYDPDFFTVLRDAESLLYVRHGSCDHTYDQTVESYTHIHTNNVFTHTFLSACRNIASCLIVEIASSRTCHQHEHYS
jgi:hypothetical protein